MLPHCYLAATLLLLPRCYLAATSLLPRCYLACCYLAVTSLLGTALFYAARGCITGCAFNAPVPISAAGICCYVFVPHSKEHLRVATTESVVGVGVGVGFVAAVMDILKVAHRGSAVRYNTHTPHGRVKQTADRVRTRQLKLLCQRGCGERLNKYDQI